MGVFIMTSVVLGHLYLRLNYTNTNRKKNSAKADLMPDVSLLIICYC